MRNFILFIPICFYLCIIKSFFCFQRGKFRPRLTQLVEQNSVDDVKTISENAFKKPRNVAGAIKELSKLKAIGPATASGKMSSSEGPFSFFPPLVVPIENSNLHEKCHSFLLQMDIDKPWGCGSVSWTWFNPRLSPTT